MEPIKLKILTDYTRTPGPRYISEGPFSGEDFRQKVLGPKIKVAISESKKLVVDIDGTAGYGTSFLEESFGGLIRVENIDYKDIMSCLEVISEEDPDYKDEVLQYLHEAYDEYRKSKD